MFHFKFKQQLHRIISVAINSAKWLPWSQSLNTFYIKRNITHILFSTDLKYSLLCDLWELLIILLPLYLQIPFFTYHAHTSLMAVLLKPLSCEDIRHKLGLTDGITWHTNFASTHSPVAVPKAQYMLFPMHNEGKCQCFHWYLLNSFAFSGILQLYKRKVLNQSLHYKQSEKKATNFLFSTNSFLCYSHNNN